MTKEINPNYIPYPELAGVIKMIQEAKGSNSFTACIYLTDSMLNTPLEEIELSVRAYNCLRRAGHSTIGDVWNYGANRDNLKRIRNCGKTTINDIYVRFMVHQYRVLSDAGKRDYLKLLIERNGLELDKL